MPFCDPRIGVPMRHSLLLLVCTCCGWMSSLRCLAADDVDFTSAPVARIPSGTIVGEDNANGWNRVVLLATPRLASGAVDKIPAVARRYATRFNVVIMACVTSADDRSSDAKYQLKQVGVGYCTNIRDQQVVITSQTEEKLGADLDTVERIVLRQNEAVLNDMVRIVKSRTIAMFDVKALVLAGGEHHDMLLRHLVWVVPGTGKIAALIWPLVTQEDGTYRLTGKTLSVVPGGFHEDRMIHVSADEITLGIPSSRAFALARMPPGKNLIADENLAKLVAQKSYDSASIKKLLAAIRKAF